VDGHAAALEAERPQLPYELNEELEPSRHVPAAGVVQVKPTPERSPIRQDDSQYTRIEEVPDKRLRHIQEARAALHRSQPDLSLVDDQASGHVDLELLVTALELPP